MPISKINQPTSGSIDLQWSAAVDAGSDGYADPPVINVGKLPQQAYQAYLMNGDHDGPEVGQRGGATESVIEREIREQRERERELAAMRKLYQQQRELAAEESFRTQPNVPENDIVDRHHVTKTDRPDGSNDDDVIHRSAEPVIVAWSAPAVEEKPEIASKSTNPEENLILLEMIEQQRREEELRQHWKEMGFELYEGHGDEEDEDEGEVFGRGGTAQAGNSIERELEAVRTQRRSQGDVNVFSVSTTTNQQQPPHPQTEVNFSSQQKTAVSVTWSDTQLVETSDQSFPETPKTSSTRRPLLLPISDDGGQVNDVAETAFRQLFEPHSESVIEREIRLAREREEALRQLRGLPPRPEDVEERRSRLVEIAVQLRNELHNRPGRRTKSEVVDVGGVSSTSLKTDQVDATDDEVFAKRFAESRLKAELQQERQRELDLRRKGLIHTISEERAGDPIRYVDMLDSGMPAATQPSASASTKRHSATKQSAAKTIPEPVETAPTAAVAAETVASEPIAQQLEERRLDELVEVTAKTEVPLEKTDVNVERQLKKETEQVIKQEKKEQKAKAVQNSPAPERRRELPIVFRTYSYPYADQQLVLSSTDGTKLTPEERIEEEVAEFKRREAELRMLREALRLQPPPLIRDQPPIDGREIVRERPRDATAFDEDEYLLQVRSRQQQDTNSEKRRLALIEQWEKKSLESATTAASTTTSSAATTI